MPADVCWACKGTGQIVMVSGPRGEDPDFQACGWCDGPGSVPVVSVLDDPWDRQAARNARDEAIQRVDAAADPEWKDRAYEAVLAAATHGEFTTDDVWLVLDRWGVPRPREPRALAPVMLRAKKEGVITPTSEFRASARTAAHMNPKRVWRSVRRAA